MNDGTLLPLEAIHDLPTTEINLQKPPRLVENEAWYGSAKESVDSKITEIEPYLTDKQKAFIRHPEIVGRLIIASSHNPDIASTGTSSTEKTLIGVKKLFENTALIAKFMSRVLQTEVPESEAQQLVAEICWTDIFKVGDPSDLNHPTTNLYLGKRLENNVRKVSTLEDVAAMKGIDTNHFIHDLEIPPDTRMAPAYSAIHPAETDRFFQTHPELADCGGPESILHHPSSGPAPRWCMSFEAVKQLLESPLGLLKTSIKETFDKYPAFIDRSGFSPETAMTATTTQIDDNFTNYFPEPHNTVLVKIMTQEMITDYKHLCDITTRFANAFRVTLGFSAT